MDRKCSKIGGMTNAYDSGQEVLKGNTTWKI
jgi:hypothetical protein